MTKQVKHSLCCCRSNCGYLSRHAKRAKRDAVSRKPLMKDSLYSTRGSVTRCYVARSATFHYGSRPESVDLARSGGAFSMMPFLVPSCWTVAESLKRHVPRA